MKYNKDGILLNGMHYFWLHGYHASGIQDVLNSCGITKGSFYHLFESKEQFAAETLELYISIVNTAFEENLLDKTIGPLERIKRYYLQQIEQCYDGDIFRGCYLANMSLEVGASSKKIRKILQFGFESNKHILQRGLKEWYDKHGYEHILQLEDLCELLQTSWYGALQKTKATGRPDALAAFLKIPFSVIADYAI